MIGLLNGSPKAPKGTSGAILQQIQNELVKNTVLLSAQYVKQEIFEQLDTCEKIVIVFPIYADALPSHLLRFFIGWEEYRKNKGEQKRCVYAVSHAGFYDGIQCRWALDILRNFCAKSGLLWCGGVGMGGAPVFGESGIPQGALRPLRDTVSLVSKIVGQGEMFSENRFINVGMPRWIYQAVGNIGWKQGAKQNGLKAKDLLRQE